MHNHIKFILNLRVQRIWLFLSIRIFKSFDYAANYKYNLWLPFENQLTTLFMAILKAKQKNRLIDSKR